MGIREEIEELRRPSLLGSQCQQEYDWLGRQVYNALQVEGDTIIDQVLSLLDEHLGELVTEGPLTNLLAKRITDLIERNVYKGDTIAIYRRKKR